MKKSLFFVFISVLLIISGCSIDSSTEQNSEILKESDDIKVSKAEKIEANQKQDKNIESIELDLLRFHLQKN
ncbi:hypothetical protein [Chengkuizengella sediminis]|uniref:hypothetical protein n=1 Tax=Chengkuizengella sediminis TaxID=1885917 RepID=UPI00138950D9|nr:hypothetical protein [Chengkuizengella sediminis]NDI34461.1 hypothetical protein [Chengkuizengella sediminis]